MSFHQLYARYFGRVLSPFNIDKRKAHHNQNISIILTIFPLNSNCTLLISVTHLKTHSGEKLNKCNQCDFASSEAGSLRRHLKTHSGEKLNKCNQCDYASSWAGALGTHLKTHSGEKSNKCDDSDFTCSDPSYFRRHLKKHRQV